MFIWYSFLWINFPKPECRIQISIRLTVSLKTKGDKTMSKVDILLVLSNETCVPVELLLEDENFRQLVKSKASYEKLLEYVNNNF